MGLFAVETETQFPRADPSTGSTPVAPVMELTVLGVAVAAVAIVRSWSSEEAKAKLKEDRQLRRQIRTEKRRGCHLCGGSGCHGDGWNPRCPECGGTGKPRGGR